MSFWWRKRREEELDAELRSHLEMVARERVERGEDGEEAEHAARREFGNGGLGGEVTRDAWGWGALDRLMQDLRFGLRILAKSPGFTAGGNLKLARGVGGDTGLFFGLNGGVL